MMKTKSCPTPNIIMMMLCYAVLPLGLFGQDAPIVKIVEKSTTDNTCMVSVTASQFADIRGCNLQILYDPEIALASSFSRGPLLGGTLSANLLTPGVITLAWFTSPGITLPDEVVLFMINFNRQAYGTTPITWNAEYPLRSWVYTNYFHLNDNPPENFYRSGALTFVPQDVNLTLLLEGLYDAGTGQMRQAQDVDGSRHPGNIADMVTVELRQGVDYNQMVLRREDVPLNCDGTCSFMLGKQLHDTYYLVVRHRNHLTAVSATPVQVGDGQVHYDFTRGPDQETGSLRELSPGIWGLVAGDINQDGRVDDLDRDAIERGFRATLQGYLPEDVNGDGLVDLADRELTNDNLLHKRMATEPSGFFRKINLKLLQP
ncbi:MAG: hypothetical protein R6U64_10435 [Bacteroidales bacterium]